MCCIDLTQQDIREIRRSRGFPKDTTVSGELLESIMLTDQGVEQVLNTLAPEEINMLHLLNAVGGVLPLPEFRRIAPNTVKLYGYSFKARYNQLYKVVRKKMIQKGILLCTTKRSKLFGSKETILERKRYLFPKEFAPFLPAPCKISAEGSQAGQIECVRLLRKKMIPELINIRSGASTGSTQKADCFAIVGGELYFDNSPFTANRLRAWLETRFDKAIETNTKGAIPVEWTPTKLAIYTLGCIPRTQWVAPDDLLPLWEFANPELEVIDPNVVCQKGFECGCLERATTKEQTLFRLALVDDIVDSPSPGDFLVEGTDRDIEVNLQRAPFAMLEVLSKIATFSIRDGSMWATPSRVKISHAASKVRDHSLFSWLLKHHASFAKAVADVKKRRGKTVIHERLLVARVTDLSLKVKLEKAFVAQDEIVAISEEYIAFPYELLPKIEKYIKKSGHVIKTVEAK